MLNIRVPGVWFIGWLCWFSYPLVNSHSNGKSTILNRRYIFKWWISHCYVRLLEGVECRFTRWFKPWPVTQLDLPDWEGGHLSNLWVRVTFNRIVGVCRPIIRIFPITGGLTMRFCDSFISFAPTSQWPSTSHQLRCTTARCESYEVASGRRQRKLCLFIVKKRGWKILKNINRLLHNRKSWFIFVNKYIDIYK